MPRGDTHAKRARTALAFAIGACLVFAFSPSLRAGATSSPAPTTLTYCSPGGVALKMDFYRPAVTRKVPVVVQVHPGGWQSFDRTEGVTPGLVNAFVKRGIAFAAIDYRLNDGRGAIQDVTCAVRYLRASAKKLNLDGTHIGAMGQSAGGQLVSLLGTADHAAGFDAGQYPKQSSRVQAVADEWGPVIFDAALLTRLPYIPSVFGTANLSALAQYSPLTYLTPDDPPFLLVHGTQDEKVPVSQSRRFAAALKAHGVSQRLIVVAHAGHGLAASGGAPKPSAAQVQRELVSFFVTQLR